MNVTIVQISAATDNHLDSEGDGHPISIVILIIAVTSYALLFHKGEKQVYLSEGRLFYFEKIINKKSLSQR